MKYRGIKGLRLLCILFIVCSLFLVSSCSEETESFDLKKKYQLDDFTIQLRGSQFTQKVSPLNPYGEGHEQAYEEEDHSIMVDLQFYVENKGDKKVDLKKYIEASMHVDNKEIEYGYYLQTKQYASVDEVSTLAAKEKSILHIIFFMDQKVFDSMKKEDKEVMITMSDTKYMLPLKEYKVKQYDLEKEQILAKDVNIKVISASSSKMIPPLNANENSNWFSVDGDTTRYAGMFVEVDNTSEQDIHIDNYFIPSLHYNNTDTLVWSKLLSEDLSMFTEDTTIPAKSKRIILFFGEVEHIIGNNEYTFQYYIEGIPYFYTFNHEVFV